MGLMPATKTIKTQNEYTVEEVFERLSGSGKMPGEPYYVPFGKTKYIYIPGVGMNDIGISVKKKKNFVTEASRPADTRKNIAIDLVTDGWATIIGRNVTNIGELVNAVAEEIQRLCP